MITLFGFIFGSGAGKFDLYVQNNDRDSSGFPSLLSRSLIATLNQSGALNIVEVPISADATRFVRDDARTHNRGARLLVIPNDFERQVDSTGRNVTLTVFVDQSDPAGSGVIGIVKSTVDSFNLRITGGSQSVGLATRFFVARGFRYVDFFVPGVVGMTLLTSGTFGAVYTNARFRENHILKKLATTPLTKVEWILGMIFYEMFQGFVSLTVILLFGRFIFGVQAEVNIYSIILIASASFLFPGMGMLVGNFAKDAEAAEAASNAVTFPVMFLSGTFWPKELLPQFLQTLAKFMPLTYINDGLRDAMINSDFAQAASNAAVALVLAAAFITLGTVTMNWREE